MNIQINPKNTFISQAVNLDRLYSSAFSKSVAIIFWFLGFGSIAYLIYDYIENEKISGISLIVLALFLIFLANKLFYAYKVKYPKTVDLNELTKKASAGEEVNLFNAFSLELAHLTKDYLLPNPDQQKIIENLIKSPDMNFILIRLGLGRDFLLEQIKNYQIDPNATFQEIIFEALNFAISEGHSQIEAGDLFAAFCQKDSFFIQLIKSLKLDIKDIQNLVYWQTKVKEYFKKELFDTKSIKLTGGIGQDWAFGFTPYLRRFAVDLTDRLQRTSTPEIIGRKKEIAQIKEDLSRRSGGNIIVVGEAGVGKRSTVMGFVKEVAEGKTNSKLDYKHILQINTDAILANVSNPGEATARLSGLLNEAASAGNIVIYIENISNLLSSGDAGKIDATEVLVPYLDAPEFHIIGTCSVSDFNQFFVPNSTLLQRFTRISIEEPPKEEMIRILEDIVPALEYNTGSIITYEAIKEAISAADKYILNMPNPEKTINLLDGVTSKASSERGKTLVFPKDVAQYVTEKFNVPTGEVEENEKEKLLALENLMHQSVIGQSEAIKAISNALRRVRAGVTDTKKPIGSFLFLGPTGVGKTETAKALARVYFGGEDRMIRFDMSEFQNKEDIYRFIGSSIGGEVIQGALTTAVREKPFSLLLFDEIEKAHRDILDLFLQILDEGHITDGTGRKVSFTNTIIICTSNAGANLIRQSISSGDDYENIKKSLIDYLQNENIYRPEFINRFNAVIAFAPLNQEEIAQVASLMIQKLEQTTAKNRNINITVAPEALAKLAELGFDPQMGARPMARVIEEKVENLLATKILSGELNPGDSLTIGLEDIN